MDYRVKCLVCDNVEYFNRPMAGWLCKDCRESSNNSLALDSNTEEGYAARVDRLEDIVAEAKGNMIKTAHEQREWFDNRMKQLEQRIYSLEDWREDKIQ